MTNYHCGFRRSPPRSAHERSDRFDQTHVQADQRNAKEPAMPLSLAGKALAVVIAVGSFGALELAPPDIHGQTVFLERLALRVDQAHRLSPEAATQISDLLARARSQRPRGGELDTRRQQAIARIESALLAKTSLRAVETEAQSSPVARR